MSSEDGLLPQVVAPFLGPPDPACWGVGAGNGGARLSLGGGGARRKAAPTPLRLAPGLAFTWSHLISFHLELDLCHVRCHLRVLERASLGEQMLSESSLPRCPCRAQGPRREGNSSEEGSRFSVGAKRFPALCPTAPTKPSAPLGGPGSSAPGAVSLATLFTFRHGDQSRSRDPRRGRKVAWEQRPAPQKVAQEVLPTWRITLGGGGRCRQGLRAGTFVAWAVLSTDAGPCQAAVTSCS